VGRHVEIQLFRLACGSQPTSRPSRAKRNGRTRARDALAESALRAIYDGYGASPLFETVLDYSQTGLTMLYEAWGTLFVGLDAQRRVQQISDRVLSGSSASLST
jgi:hypothetical protein